jgi:hypothetical protein
MLRLVPADLSPVTPPVELPAPPPVIAPVVEAAPARSWTGRAFAMILLAGTIAGLGWAGVQGYYLLTDAWIAPLHLSRDSDNVAQLRLAHQRTMDELARVDAEVTRLDGELAAIEVAVEKLASLRDSAKHTLAWQAEANRVEANGYAEATTLMKRQLDGLGKLHEREVGLVARARADLAAGMIDRTAVDREEQLRDQLAVQMTDLERQIAEASVHGHQSRTAMRALRGDHGAVGVMPEVAAGDEHTARIDVEIERLQAEARGDRALRAAAQSSVVSERGLLAELESRPLYRAMTTSTDIAFVPYTQLDKLHAGDRIVACFWSVFSCHGVGQVAEILPGEVVTQDPWGEMARGQFIVLALADKDAIRERVLRVRR